MHEIKLDFSTNKLQQRTSRVIFSDMLDALNQLKLEIKPIFFIDQSIASMCSNLKAHGQIVPIPGGESIKTLTNISMLYQKLIAHDYGRDALVVGVGGGAVVDAVGFVAATFQRGVRLGFIPTTLLAQVDASVGGKNGVNLGVAKNQIGTIWQPEFVICDQKFLNSLSNIEYVSGCAEMIKAGLIADQDYFNQLESSAAKVLARDYETLALMISRAVAIKAKVVQADETEESSRMLLNFGHTLGHAIEKVDCIPHGHAISIGMMAAAKLAKSKGCLSESDLERVKNILDIYRLPSDLKVLKKEYAELMLADKKRRGDKINLILLDEIGKARVEKFPIAIAEELIQCALA